MKGWQIVTVLLLCLILIGSVSCNPFGGSEAESNQQLVEVTRGDLTVTVNGIGNIAISEERTLSFGADGKVEEIYIEEGDKVNKGDVLARLETEALELAVTQAKLAITEAQVALREAKYNAWEGDMLARLETEALELAVTQAKLAITEAQVNLREAEYDAEETQDLIVWPDVRTAIANLEDAERYLADAKERLGWAAPDSLGEEWLQKAVIHAQARLNTAEDKLDAMLAGLDPELLAIKKFQVELTQQSIEEAQQSLTYAQEQLDKEAITAPEAAAIRTLQVELTQQSLEEAQQSLEQAQKQLDEATLTAPFDGVAASVDVDEGDSVSSSTTIVHFVDLTSLELEVEVDEIDILSVKLGQRAIISVDALPDVELAGKVTFIPPVSREEPGLVLYDVKIGFDVPPGFELRGGMSATADIVIDERSNVLLVPNQAITLDSQGNPIVTVLVNELTQERRVVTGISNGSHTEILGGLDEGDVVVVAIER